MWQQYLEDIGGGNIKSLARAISLVENDTSGVDELLKQLRPSDTPVIGITGPPGAGKSTLADALIGELVSRGKRVGILCIDPSSPFNMGAVLGDRIRMSDWYTHPNVFIRSLATRGSMGGLHPRIVEITDVMKVYPFDIIILETVGVGQSEIEIAGLADVTVVVLVPEGGDEIQTMKAGLMEIADVFVVNKADRPDADLFVKNLRQMFAPAFSRQQEEIPIIKTVASAKTGITELYSHIQALSKVPTLSDKHLWLLAEKAYHLLEQKRMKGVSKDVLKNIIEMRLRDGNFNLYQFISEM